MVKWIMNTKLTLKLEDSVISRAKVYARANNISLSKMIENYLQALTEKQSKEIEISPLVASLLGVIGPQEGNPKKDYTKYLSDKYE